MDFLQNLNFLDILTIIIILILSLFAAVKGLFKNIVLFALAIFAVMIAEILAQKVQQNYINSIINDPSTAYVVSFILVLMTAYLIIFGIMQIFMKNNKENEGLLNILLTFFIAVVRYSFMFAITFSTLNSFSLVKEKSFWQNSIAVPALVKIGDYAFNTKVKVQEINLKDYVPGT